VDVPHCVCGTFFRTTAAVTSETLLMHTIPLLHIATADAQPVGYNDPEFIFKIIKPSVKRLVVYSPRSKGVVVISDNRK
jgi:hypothetical protein